MPFRRWGYGPTNQTVSRSSHCHSKSLPIAGQPRSWYIDPVLSPGMNETYRWKRTRRNFDWSICLSN